MKKIHFQKPGKSVSMLSAICLVLLSSSIFAFTQNIVVSTNLQSIKAKESELVKDLAELSSKNSETEQALFSLQNEDQVIRNDELAKEIEAIQETYKKAVKAYEDMLDLSSKNINVTSYEEKYAEIVAYLANKELTKATDTLAGLQKSISEENSKLASASVNIPANIPVENTPPGSGYSRQQVATDVGNFLVSLIAADLSSTRVIVDTASDSDCANDCPVLPLATYVSRSGAYAGVNGSYFCPASYPTCVGKTNSFDLLAMNKNKYYFNSGNNVYSNNPAVIFGGSYIRFVSASSQWGRDTGVDGVLSNYPLLISGENIVFGGDGDPKKGSKGNRSFVANRGNTVYIGVVHSATVAESGHALKALGMENALNLDNGGSTALWSGGYKVGPGRDLPNVILFVKK